MRYAFYTFLIATSSVALAQNRPQLSWQGYVSGSAVLHIQGDRVDVQGRDTGSVERPNVNMFEPLPAVRQTIQMDVKRGRGRVQVVEHPTPRNEFTATVRIDPVGTRHELYDIDFFWDAGAGRLNSRRNRRNDNYEYGTGTRSRTNDRYASAGEMTWSGTVDQEALIEIRGQVANVRTVRGQRVYGSNPRFSAPLPRQNVAVRLDQAQGRGRVELVQEPSANNNYAAIVRILDDEGGAGQYAFRLVWDDGYGDTGAYGTYRNDPYTANSGGILTPQGGQAGGYDPYYGSASGSNSMRWAARVDGTVRVSVRGNRASSTRVSGQPVYGEQVAFGGALPARSGSDVEIRKLRGRGDVDIIQRPSSNNGYTLIFQVEDSDGGADDYEVEVLWR